DAVITVGATPTVVPVIARDVLNVYPDPPVVEQNPSLRVNGIPASLIARQPGGEWVVVEVPYGTGTGTGYRYYLYHLGTNETVFFAQSPSYQAQFTWHPYGQRLYFFFVDGSLESPRYEVVFPEVELHRARLSSSADGGVWSPDGKFRALVQGTSLSVYNAETGAIRRYCIPNFAGLSRSELRWSP